MGLLAGLCLATPALADGPEPKARTEYTAYTLDDGEFKLGLWGLHYGITDRWQVGTHSIFWALGPNATVKWHGLQSGPWSLGAKLGVFSINLSAFGVDEETAQLTAVPINLVGGYEWGDWGFHLALNITQITGSGEGAVSTGDDEDQNVDGLLAVDTTSLTPALEWRVGDHLALIFEANIMLEQSASAQAKTTFTLDQQTEVDVFGGGDVADESEGFTGNWSVSLYWRWETFNLKVGGGYGNYHFPPLYVFLPQKSFTPQFDMFWRF